MEYRTAGLGPIVANPGTSRLMENPPYGSISIRNWQLWCPDVAGIMTKVVPTVDAEHIAAIHRKFMEVCNKDTAVTHLPHRSTDHAIGLELSYTFSYGRIYNILELELGSQKACIVADLANVFIQLSSLPAEASILFGKMNDGGVKLCVDYCTFNLAMVKYRYPLPSISEMIDRVHEARIFTRLDLHSAYNLIRIKQGNRFQMAFGIHSGQFESRAMPFRSTHTPAKFH